MPIGFRGATDKPRTLVVCARRLALGCSKDVTVVVSTYPRPKLQANESWTWHLHVTPYLQREDVVVSQCIFTLPIYRKRVNLRYLQGIL